MSMDALTARQVVLVQAIETADRDGRLLGLAEREQHNALAARRVAVAAAGGQALPVEQLLGERAAGLLQAVHGRHSAIDALRVPARWQRWLAPGAFLAALVLGMASDRVANPHRLDLLSLPLLAIVLWNLCVYAWLLVRYIQPGARGSSDGVLPDGLQAGQGARAGAGMDNARAAAGIDSARAAGARARAAIGARAARAATSAHAAQPMAASVARWLREARDNLRTGRRRDGALQADVAAFFYLHWNRLTAALGMLRAACLLHLAAAGWGAGIVASLFMRGLVVEYRVGWESTFLNAQQVHGVLQLLLKPALALFPASSFSVAEVAALRFAEGGGAAAGGARWVVLYSVLLALVVVLPRLALAGWTAWRERQLAGALRLDLSQPYFQHLVAALYPAQVRLGYWAARDADRALWLRVLQAAPLRPSAAPAGPNAPLATTDAGDALHLTDDTPGATAPLFGSAQGAATDVLLHLTPGADQLSRDVPLLQRAGRALLLVLDDSAAAPGSGPTQRQSLHPQSSHSQLLHPQSTHPQSPNLQAVRVEAAHAGLRAQVLHADDCLRCWVQEPALWQAVGVLLPATQQAGMVRLAAARARQHRQRFDSAMATLALQLAEAACEVEAVRSAPFSVMNLVNPAERSRAGQARRDAMAAVAERLARAAALTQARLCSLHGIDAASDAAGHAPPDAGTPVALGAPVVRMPADASSPTGADRLNADLANANRPAADLGDGGFLVRAAVNTPQAGMAGAATGAAMGASVDLMVGGLTLGAAAALGALVGGGAAYVAAALKNKTGASNPGVSTVQLQDDTMQALTETALLRYLDVAHQGRGGATAERLARWHSEVAAAVQAHGATLRPLWAAARAQTDAADPADQPPAWEPAALTQVLETIGMQLLDALYPAAQEIGVLSKT